MNLTDGCAIIPAAGMGSRLKPHTHTTPKPLLSVGGKPILGHIIDEIVGLGIRKVALIVGYRGDQIVDFAKDRYADCEIIAVRQERPEGIGHAVFQAREHAEGQPTLIVFGDTVFECDLTQIADMDVDGAIGVCQVDDPSRFGVVQLKGSHIVGVVEKPDHYVSDQAMVGVNLIRDSDRLFACLEEMIAKGQRTRGEFQITDAFGMMVDAGSHLHAFPVDNWFDCGVTESLLETNRHLLGRLPEPTQRDGVILIPPVYVADSATVTNSVVGPHVSVGENARISNSIIKDSIVGADAQVERCFLHQSLIGDNAVVEAGARKLNVGDSSEVMLY
ncbi:NTP transferase domain-containing protein [bacterium]|nr:NTP transferase domain-containing protein [bacterium]